jgi:hypothetical protein
VENRGQIFFLKKVLKKFAGSKKSLTFATAFREMLLTKLGTMRQ